MPPKFKPGDSVIYDISPQNHPFCAHSPGAAGCKGSKHEVVDVLPFTLHPGQVVNVKGLGSCTVDRVFGRTVKLARHHDSAEHVYLYDVTDVDEPDGTPIPSYELKDPMCNEDGIEIWASENTFTLVKAHDPNVFVSTTWESALDRAKQRRSMRLQSATNAWAHF